ncbi:MAG: hypothetical protein U0T82_09965 [Bacteroidales bacterium]
MKAIYTNPFVTGGYSGPEFFCDRQSETQHLIKAIRSKRNVTLISLRRMGKTGLLKHIKHLLDQEKRSIEVIYIDLLPTMNGNDMLNAMASALLRAKQHDKSVFEKLMGLLASLRPKLGYDQFSGQPSLELQIQSPADIKLGMGHLLEFISGFKRDILFLIDEFQQITWYPEKNMEQLLRTIIQSYPSISFIFSGSNKHMLETMFSATGRPFYQSAELMYLDTIPEAEYSEFISQKFTSGNKKVSEDAISTILKWTRSHTFYVQHTCNLLYESASDEINIQLINQTFEYILNSYEPLFAGYRKLLPAHQYKLLQAIAVENGIEKPTSGSFIHRYNLTSASSVKGSLKALEEKEMIVFTGKQWYVYDVFFANWLAYHYGGK